MLPACARLGLLLLAALSLGATEFDDAYKSLANRDYDNAVTHFRAGLKAEPGNAAAHKDLAYTLLKAGENSEARDEFEAAVAINRHDDSAELEFAFLAFETGKPIEARRTFDRLRKQGSATTRTTAEHAFQNIDKPLADGIARWQEALTRSARPNELEMFSAHWELAHLAELRDQLQLASDQYQICRELKPQLGEILLIEARLWQQLNRVEDAKAAILAASRAPNPRTSEQGLALWGDRYPYAYEFVNAIALDPDNVSMRHELGFLYLAMNKRDEAIGVFEQALKIDSRDEVAKKQLESLRHTATLPHPTPVISDSRAMGFKSLSLGYARDAIRYLSKAHDDNPQDLEIVLKLGWAYNYAHDDATAIKYFEQARHASDPAVATEARQAYKNLTGGVEPQTTMWLLPMYSSRWNDVFSYGQWKHTLPLPVHCISIYVSSRFDGDLKSSIPAGSKTPLYLSQSSVVAGVGVATKTWHHLTFWAEAGEAMNYLPFRRDEGWAVPDYRGGINYVRGFGHLLGTSSPGLFLETSFDGVFVSRFNKDWIFSSQARSGWTVGSAEFYWNINNTHDMKNQYWAETIEVGPGMKWHLSWMRPGVYFSADFLRGIYTNNLGNPRRPNYNDARIGFWYAFSR